MAGAPDFDELYRCAHCPHSPGDDTTADLPEPQDRSHRGLSPRMAARLWAMARYLADHYRASPDHLISELPPVARPYAKEAWLERLLQCFEDLGDRLATGGFVLSELCNCTGDELALHFVIDNAAAAHEDAWEHAPEERTLAAVGEEDTDFLWAGEILLADTDVLMLFNAAMDGVESDDEVKAGLATANLHPREWFLPFRTDGP